MPSFCRAVPVVFLGLSLAILHPASARGQDMPLGNVLIEGQGWELVGEGYKFTEGPAADAAGNVYFSDIPNNRIHKVGLDGKVTVFAENTQAANGLMVGPDGRLYACQNGAKKIVAYDAKGVAATIAENVASNDLVVNRAGGIYFTDPAGGKVFYIKAGGQPVVVASEVRPNGVILTPDQGTLVITDGQEPCLWAFRVETDGTLSAKERYYYPLQLANYDTRPGTDGLTVDQAGRLYATSRSGVQVFDPTGRLSGTILKPSTAGISNVAFGGPNLDTLYVTATDKVYRRKTKAAGVLYFQPPWKSLFDGRTLTNWKSGEFGGDGEIKVENGRIVMEQGNDMTGVTFKGEVPRDNYEVSLEAMKLDGNDFFCGLTFPVGKDPCSFIVGGWGGGVVGLSSLDGNDAAHNETATNMNFEKNRWYTIRVRVTPAKIVCWIDNKQVVEAERAGRKISIRPEVEGSKPLGVSCWQTKSALREIKIRELPAEKPAAPGTTPANPPKKG